MIIPELKVTNLNKSLDFYVGMAEFKILYKRLEHGFAMLEINNAYLMLEEISDKSRSWLINQIEKPFGQGMHLQIEIQDVQRLYQNFITASYPIFLKMEEKWYRKEEEEIGHQQFLVQDPDGYLLRFFEKIEIRPFTK